MTVSPKLRLLAPLSTVSKPLDRVVEHLRCAAAMPGAMATVPARAPPRAALAAVLLVWAGGRCGRFEHI